MRKVTIKDIAKKLDMHHSTVSRALKGKPEISEKTRVMVTQAALEMGYTPNLAALALRGESSKTVAVAVPDISHAGIRKSINELSDLLWKDGINLAIYVNKNKRAEDFKQMFAGSPVAAIAFSFSSSTGMRILKLAENSRQRLLVVDLDYEPSLLSAIDTLISQNNRKLFLVSGCHETDALQAPFKEALLDHYIPYLGDSFISGINTVGEGAGLANRLASRFDKPDAIIFTSAEAAIGFYTAHQGVAKSASILVVSLEESPLLDAFPEVVFQSPMLDIDAKQIARLILDFTENSLPMTISGY